MTTTYVNGEECIWVLDPMTRKLLVPRSYLIPTQASNTPGTVPSLCIAYLENRCQHTWCRQAHVRPDTISKLRQDALNAPTCCSEHGAINDISCLTSRFKTITITDSIRYEAIPTSRVALTVGLQRHLAQHVSHDNTNSNLDLPSKQICRLHLACRCRYLEDCNNIHVCRKVDLRLHPPTSMVQPMINIIPSMRSICLGDVQYSVEVLARADVSDEEFHLICERYQGQDNNNNNNNNN
eukprot:Tbor_TRINITY_DN6177_c0_g4::TRINITY_DN6177_c0_g4_i2::g.22734::m.22734